MDVRGWIPIALLASFKRVRILTLQEQLVYEVLTLSQVLEVRSDWIPTSKVTGGRQFKR